MIFEGRDKEYICLETIDASKSALLANKNDNDLTILWFTSDSNIILIDGIEHSFNKNEMICYTSLHKIEVRNLNSVNYLRFNRPFFCVVEHDSEVGCKGILFFGASQIPRITIQESDFEIFETVWKMFSIEMKSNDRLQMEMLQTMLKRYLILCTRLYKAQNQLNDLEPKSSDIIREFNYLVENHFKTKHTVAEYADLLNKSPKTLSNVFLKLGKKSPLQYIQERKMLEARRMLRYSDKQVKEIAFELGYEDVQTFSRFFKVNEGLSPSEFKEK